MIRLENFFPGIYTQPGKIPSGVTTAADMSNLRVDKDGFLRPRIGTSLVGAPYATEDPKIEGIAQAGHIVFISVSGHLYVTVDGGLTTALIEHVSGLSGRLSVVSHFQNFVLLTSEGQDTGFWIDISDPSDITAHRLGFPAPEFTPIFTTIHTVIGDAPQWNKYYYYRWAFYGSPFSEVEGKVSEVFESGWQDAPDPGDVVRRIISGVEFPEWDIQGDVTGLRVYRSDAYDAATEEPENFKLLGTVALDETSFVDRIPDVDRTTALVDESLNTIFPSTATSITYYNGRVFATCGTELRFNDVTGTIPHWERWPPWNSIYRQRCEFAFEYFGTLYFGDQNNTWRVAGIPETESFTSPVEPISSVGALDSYAVTALEKGVAIIGESGLFIGDGISWERVSSPLDEIFADETIAGGHVIQFPNGNILWSCLMLSGNHQQFLMHIDGALGVRWDSWRGVEAVQSVRLATDFVRLRAFDHTWVDENGDSWLFSGGDSDTSDVVIADGGPRPRRILWRDERSGESDEDIEWFWESHDVFYRQQGLAMDRKLFRRLLVRGIADNDVTLRFNLRGGVDDNEVERVITSTIGLSTGEPTRVPIRRRGESLSFKIAGRGNCQVRGFYLDFDIVRAWR